MNVRKSNRLNSFVTTKNEFENIINISIISTNTKVGKSMFTDLLCQTDFIDRTMILRNDQFTFLNDKSIIIRKISSKKSM